MNTFMCIQSYRMRVTRLYFHSISDVLFVDTAVYNATVNIVNTRRNSVNSLQDAMYCACYNCLPVCSVRPVGKGAGVIGVKPLPQKSNHKIFHGLQMAEWLTHFYFGTAILMVGYCRISKLNEWH